MIKIETSLLGERNALLRMEVGQRPGHDEKLKGPGPRSHNLYRPFDLHSACLLLHGWFAYCPPPLASEALDHRAFASILCFVCSPCPARVPVSFYHWCLSCTHHDTLEPPSAPNLVP